MSSALVKPALLRIAILVLALAGYEMLLVPVIFRDTTDALGPGLLMFLGLVVVCGVWAVVDSHRAAGTGEVLLRWLVVAAGVGLLAALLFGGLGYPDTAVEDLVLFAPFFTVLVLVPASVGAALGRIGRRAARV